MPVDDADYVLSNLAREYTRASGEAYAAGGDLAAADLRDASRRIEELRKALPPLPKPKVAHRGG